MRAAGMGLRLIVLATATMFQFGGTANAQDVLARAQSRLVEGVKRLQTACGPDMHQFCSSVTPGDARMFFCVIAHEDKISAICNYALFNAARNMDQALSRIEEVADACWPDVEKNCAGVVAGNGRVMQCLAEKRAALTPQCQAAVSQP